MASLPRRERMSEDSREVYFEFTQVGSSVQ
jgi:hypothetical protein